MIVVEHGRGRIAASIAMRSMFEARKKVFVDLLKWDLPTSGDRYEIDQFDDERAAYLIIADDHGRHLGSARLLQTSRPHILGSLFPWLCAGRVPSGPRILEITRFCLDPRQGALKRRNTRNRLVSALVRFALENQVEFYTGVAELVWLQQILAFGWDCRPLGLPQVLSSRMTGALQISITAQTPELLHQSGMWVEEEFATPALARAA